MTRYSSEEFIETLQHSDPPEEFNQLLQALWFDANGDWEAAHELVQSVYTHEAAWIHAYLHRKKGDLDNARHWYSKAGKDIPDHSFKEEWDLMLEEFL